MGVKNLLKNIAQEPISNVINVYNFAYFDANYILHYLIYKCTSDFDLYIKIHDYFKLFFETVQIQSQIHIMFDGEFDKKLIEDPKFLTHQTRSKNITVSDDYDKQKISPHCDIIRTFKTLILNILEKFKKLYRLNFQCIINDDSIAGEADIKILESIYDFGSKISSVCIVSKDTDMILIAYSAVENLNIKIDILSSLRPVYFININKLSIIKPSAQLLVNNHNKMKLDYVLIVLLLGNDYLPKISNVNYSLLLDSYHKYLIHDNEVIISDGKLNYNNLINYITYLIVYKKIKLNYKKLNSNRFKIYFNNLVWCLKHYKILKNDNIYMKDLFYEENPKIKYTINIYNFIYSN